MFVFLIIFLYVKRYFLLSDIPVVLFPSYAIGDNAIIGANAVVNKPVPDNAVVAGVPAKIIRIKKDEEC